MNQKKLFTLIGENAKRLPDKMALECGEERISYRQLEILVNQYANLLVENGVSKESLVGVYVNRSAKMIITLLAILRVGAAYVPMDPTHPTERNHYIIEEAKFPLIVSEKELTNELPKQVKVLELDCIWDNLAQKSNVFSEEELQENHLAYVIFTSGSTGKPKGVEVYYEGMMNYLVCVSNRTGLTENVRGISVVTITFDISISEMFLPLINGGTLVIANDDVVKDGVKLVELIEKEKITLMGFTPSTAYMLLEAGWKDIKGVTLLIGGEAWNMELAEALFERGCSELWNMYGPTETTIYSSMAKIHPKDKFISLGDVLDLTEFYVLDENGKQVEVGQEGELYIGGIGVAKGYLNRDDLTAERFLPNPFGMGRIYKTGDLVKLTDGGHIIYISRLDYQVKIRGYRIELGEIESAILRYDGVLQVVVFVNGSGQNAELCAFFKPKEGVEINSLDLRVELEKLIPGYMIPNRFFCVSDFPMTPNRKIDRKALMEMANQDNSKQKYIAPRNEIEQMIADLWEELLEITDISVFDNFLLLGGHSLMANRLLIKINRTFGTNLTLLELLTNDMTIEQMALLVEENMISNLSEEELASLLTEE